MTNYRSTPKPLPSERDHTAEIQAELQTLSWGERMMLQLSITWDAGGKIERDYPYLGSLFDDAIRFKEAEFRASQAPCPPMVQGGAGGGLTNVNPFSDAAVCVPRARPNEWTWA